MSKENARGMQDDAISRQVVLNEFCHSCDGWSCNPNTCCKTEWIRKLPTIHPVNNSENPNGSDVISRQAAIDATKKHYRAHDNDLLELIAFDIEQLPSVQPETEWNNHTVACLLAELFGDDCACNYNGIDEWLPEKCEVIDACPNPVGVACWEQFLKHRAGRRTDE